MLVPELLVKMDSLLAKSVVLPLPTLVVPTITLYNLPSHRALMISKVFGDAPSCSLKLIHVVQGTIQGSSEVSSPALDSEWKIQGTTKQVVSANRPALESPAEFELLKGQTWEVHDGPANSHPEAASASW